MPKLVSALIAEAIGVFALSFIGIMAIHVLKDQQAGLIGIALAHGLILAIMITITAATSGGHINPAVTIGLLVGGKIKGPEALGYIGAQLLGGLVAGLAVLVIFGTTDGTKFIVQGTPGGVTGITPLAGCIAEAIATFFLVFAVWGTAVDPRAPKIGGFGIGLTVAADILALGPLTGAAMNPARAFGPALSAATLYNWGTMWIYWVGPIAGGIAASLVYKTWMWPRKGDM